MYHSVQSCYCHYDWLINYASEHFPSCWSVSTSEDNAALSHTERFEMRRRHFKIGMILKACFPLYFRRCHHSYRAAFGVNKSLICSALYIYALSLSSAFYFCGSNQIWILQTWHFSRCNFAVLTLKTKAILSELCVMMFKCIFSLLW